MNIIIVFFYGGLHGNLPAPGKKQKQKNLPGAAAFPQKKESNSSKSKDSFVQQAEDG
jgi:hypothetical protein